MTDDASQAIADLIHLAEQRAQTARRKALEEMRDMACLWCKNGWALVEDCPDLH